jgi:DNA-binding NarL/FixJ family response regulator
MLPDENSQRRRVFIVDDHPLVREGLTNLVNQQADLIGCGEAATAAEAMQNIPAAHPEIVIVDLSLGDSSGIELIKDLKRSYPALFVLVLSMHEEAHYAERALRAGARGYLVKRETTRKVIEAIRTVLEGRFFLNDALSQVITAEFVAGKTLATRSPVEQLSDRELAVFDLLGQGWSTRRIAETLHVSVKTVQAYYARIKDKLHLGSVTELIREAVRRGQTGDEE